MKNVHVPTYDKLMNPLITALKDLGGSGTIEEIDARVAEIADVTDEQLEVLHNPEKGGGKTEIEYRLAWARTYLKKYGVLENSECDEYTNELMDRIEREGLIISRDKEDI